MIDKSRKESSSAALFFMRGEEADFREMAILRHRHFARYKGVTMMCAQQINRLHRFEGADREYVHRSLTVCGKTMSIFF